ncbi:MAG TPA: DUF2330 domain-containing protein [Polyangiaceae bacterium]|nr:DUF2330 domain-containing protein [Polyangiaceae bacterium]
MNKHTRGIIALAGVTLATAFVPAQARACGGFFCSQTAGVNQAAERIVFAQNDDGTVTAVIEIQYQGPSNKFSWLLPISSVPMGDQIAVASSLSFQRLQQATNPQYLLTRRVEGTCEQDPTLDLGLGGDSAGFDAGGAGSEGPGAVTVEASGLVGSFEWTVISVDAGSAAPADAAVNWLNDNGYDVPQGAPGLLGPYLADGLHLLALRLQKGASTGSIRPIMLTYDATKPMIPIKLTAVAAADDMGVMAWVLGNSRAVPKNYNALELNDARINWFNPNLNYNSVVTAAADESGGQGFVTEFAQPSKSLSGVVWGPLDESDWSYAKRGLSGADPGLAIVDIMFTLSQWDGFWEAFQKHVTWPAKVSFAAVQNCPDCYEGQYSVDADFVTALESDVIEPARSVQRLIDAHPQVTRLYSTLSAPEMTVDPLFTFNASLPDVSNIHTAVQVIECGRGYYESDAPWRIELPQGGVVRGNAKLYGNWPTEFDGQPANRRILREGETGSGKVLEDNSSAIDQDIATYSDGVQTPPRHPEIPNTRGPNFNPGTGGTGGTGGSAGASTVDNSGTPIDSTQGLSAKGGGCSLSTNSSSGAWLVVLSAAAFARRRRARRR